MFRMGQAAVRFVLLGLGAVLGLTFAVELAHAQEPIEEAAEPDFDDRHKAADAEHEAGRGRGDREAREHFERCATILIDLYNDFPDSSQADVLLHKAAHCSEAAGMVGQAVQIRTALINRYPNSHLAEPTLLTLAESYAAIAYYEDAARRYEQFAKQYPNSPEAPDAWQNAYLFRAGLSQTDEALQDLDEWQRLYERGYPEKAAKIFWSRRHHLETSEQQREHALAYLQRYRNTPRDLSLVAEAVIAQIDWRSSCTEPLLHDSCISIERVEQADTPGKLPKRCGGARRAIITVHAREPKLAAEAQARFQRILAAIHNKARPIGIPIEAVQRQSDFDDAWAMAMVYQADAKFEDFLRLEPPDSVQRPTAFVDQKLALAETLHHRYAVEVSDSLHWGLVAVGREAMLLESFAEQIDHARVPRSLRDPQQIQAHCDQLADVAAPIRERAIAAYVSCIERSTEFQFFNESSRMCEARLAGLDPLRYPETRELFGESVYASTRMRTVGVLPESGVPEAPVAPE
jgi:tetratricopeptide (TPR) repeat protein